MAVTATITDQFKVERRLYVEGTLVFSGSYVNNGEVPTFPGLRSKNASPVRMFVNAVTGLYQFSYDPLTGKLIVGQGDNTNAAAAPGIQLTAAAYPAALTSSVTYFQAWFRLP